MGRQPTSRGSLGPAFLGFHDRHLVNLAVFIVCRPLAGLLTLVEITGAKLRPVLSEPFPIARRDSAVQLTRRPNSPVLMELGVICLSSFRRCHAGRSNFGVSFANAQLTGASLDSRASHPAPASIIARQACNVERRKILDVRRREPVFRQYRAVERHPPAAPPPSRFRNLPRSVIDERYNTVRSPRSGPSNELTRRCKQKPAP